MAGREIAKHFTGIPLRSFDRQPARTASTIGLLGHLPDLTLPALQQRKQRPTRKRGHGDLNALHSWAHAFGHSFDRQLVAPVAGIPFHMDPIEIEVQAGHRRIVRRIDSLTVIDLGHLNESRAVDHESPRCPLDTARYKGRAHGCETVRVEFGIAAAGQDQITLHLPAPDRTGRQKAGLKPVLGTHGVQRECCCR